MQYLGFWVTRDGVKLVDKNISNKNMKPPAYRKEVRQFIFVVSYYRNMWTRRSHTLATLIIITPRNIKFKWTKIEQDAFNKTKWIVFCDSLLDYPVLNEEFKTHTDDHNLP